MRTRMGFEMDAQFEFKQMFQEGDEGHLKAMEEMKGLMSDPNAMNQWFEGKRKEFEALPAD